MQLHPDFLTMPLAHRTLHDAGRGRPENSVEGAQAAIAHGYGMEIDVQLSKDGCAMVFHDETLDRMTGHTGAVREHTAAELSAIPLRGGREPIPTLPAFLDLVAGRVPLLIEIKDQDGQMGRNVGPLEAAVCKALSDYCGPVAVMSFNPHSVAVCAELAPKVPRGLATDPFSPSGLRQISFGRRSELLSIPAGRRAELAVIPDYDRVGACFISHNVRDLDSPQVRRIRAKGGHILCWTVRSARQERRARRFADNITFERYHALKTSG